jgi:hypothetical protein
VYADSVGHFRVFLTAPKQREKRAEMRFTITDNASKVSETVSTIFVSDHQ